MPKATVLTEQKKKALCDALRECMPLSYACDLVGVPRRTVYDHMGKDEAFRTQVDIAKAVAIRGLVEATNKQSGAWKLLKNLGKEEFKEIVEYRVDESTPILIAGDGDDGEQI